ncbi:hypothetical protein [Mesorhizobium sp. B4-1-1]|uniref:hypothetical protein n=1 Tax=Mesorhizobium sp. B4-1-1 TaxID=2589890 RepID=UPI00112D2B1E|nr:hypothetical protein [Mesorhizobium sp. B4-1-1]TPI21396.1 hypothetical protein FJW10_07395 [Mesorhizobium sp. B4-1-1]
MLDRIFTWFESRYSPVALAEDRQPPMGLWRFYWYFIRQFRTASGGFLLEEKQAADDLVTKGEAAE